MPVRRSVIQMMVWHIELYSLCEHHLSPSSAAGPTSFGYWTPMRASVAGSMTRPHAVMESSSSGRCIQAAHFWTTVWGVQKQNLAYCYQCCSWYFRGRKTPAAGSRARAVDMVLGLGRAEVAAVGARVVRAWRGALQRL